jgi:hypothetical protein
MFPLMILVVIEERLYVYFRKDYQLQTLRSNYGYLLNMKTCSSYQL